ncbi:hypothetical protein EDB19DRAFT_1770688 [Suillus lakei]|nr:hypothetical protein EDB19DRAFT_1770688 [Suillus lakei]
MHRGTVQVSCVPNGGVYRCPASSSFSWGTAMAPPDGDKMHISNSLNACVQSLARLYSKHPPSATRTHQYLPEAATVTRMLGPGGAILCPPVQRCKTPNKDASSRITGLKLPPPGSAPITRYHTCTHTTTSSSRLVPATHGRRQSQAQMWQIRLVAQVKA